MLPLERLEKDGIPKHLLEGWLDAKGISWSSMQKEFLLRTFLWRIIVILLLLGTATCIMTLVTSDTRFALASRLAGLGGLITLIVLHRQRFVYEEFFKDQTFLRQLIGESWQSTPERLMGRNQVGAHVETRLRGMARDIESLRIRIESRGEDETAANTHQLCLEWDKARQDFKTAWETAEKFCLASPKKMYFDWAVQSLRVGA